MQFSCLIFAAVVACVCAEGSRHPRDVSWSSKALGGTMWAKLGNDLTGSAGYKRDIFDNKNGVLQGQVYGSRDVLSDISKIGGELNWRNPQDTIRAEVSVNKEIGGRTGVSVTGAKAWQVDKDTHFVVGAGVSKTEGQQAEGQIKAELSKDW